VLDGTEVNEIPARVNAASDIEKFIVNSVSSIIYSDIFDSAQETSCILGADLMDALGLEFGDEVRVNFIDFRNRIREQNPSADEERFNILLSRQSAYYIVAGRLESDSPDFNNSVFVSVNDEIYPLFRNQDWGFAIPLTYAEFVLADNYSAEEFRAYGIRRSGDRGRSFMTDTSELESVIANKNLWNALFPVISIVLIIMSGLLSSLLILSSSKEAAIFRVLSTSKVQIRAILINGQLLFCIIGILLGIGAARLLNGSEIFAELYPLIGIYAVLCFIVNIFAAGFCAVSATKHNVLELLQIKEYLWRY
jgi:hypothetical protein